MEELFAVDNDVVFGVDVSVQSSCFIGGDFAVWLWAFVLPEGVGCLVVFVFPNVIFEFTGVVKGHAA